MATTGGQTKVGSHSSESIPERPETSQTVGTPNPSPAPLSGGQASASRYRSEIARQPLPTPNVPTAPDRKLGGPEKKNNEGKEGRESKEVMEDGHVPGGKWRKWYNCGPCWTLIVILVTLVAISMISWNHINMLKPRSQSVVSQSSEPKTVYKQIDLAAIDQTIVININEGLAPLAGIPLQIQDMIATVKLGTEVGKSKTQYHAYGQVGGSWLIEGFNGINNVTRKIAANTTTFLAHLVRAFEETDAAFGAISVGGVVKMTEKYRMCTLANSATAVYFDLIDSFYTLFIPGPAKLFQAIANQACISMLLWDLPIPPESLSNGLIRVGNRRLELVRAGCLSLPRGSPATFRMCASEETRHWMSKFDESLRTWVFQIIQDLELGMERLQAVLGNHLVHWIAVSDAHECDWAGAEEAMRRWNISAIPYKRTTEEADYRIAVMRLWQMEADLRVHDPWCRIVRLDKTIRTTAWEGIKKECLAKFGEHPDEKINGHFDERE